jgi:hypothetical protein
MTRKRRRSLLESLKTDSESGVPVTGLKANFAGPPISLRRSWPGVEGTSELRVAPNFFGNGLSRQSVRRRGL